MMKKKSLQYISVLNVISAIAVVYMHAQFAFYAFSDEKYWFVTNLIRSLMYFCVPVFFMISGATLFDYKEKYSTREFFKKRVKKVIIPFLVWSIIALIYCILMGKVEIKNLTVVEILNGILNAKYQDVYWYFPVIISIYFCIPLFASINKKMKKSILSFLAVSGFILNFFIPFIISIFNLNIYFPLKSYVCLNYILYFIVGYLLSKYELKKKYIYFIYLLGIISLLAQIFGTYYFSINSGTIVQTFLGYDKLPCFLYSISIFTFVKNYSSYITKNIILCKIVSFLNKYTFSIYLIHMYVREICVRFLHLNTLSIKYMIFMPIPIIIICIGITWVLRKIKLTRYIVPE